MILPLTPDRWRRVAELYDTAMTLPKDERESFLSSACGGDSSLHAELESLLAQTDVASPVDGPVWMPEDFLQPPPALSAGAMLGPYVIEAVIGAGGMGEVYRARDTKLGRRVALKVLPDGLSTNPEHRVRFQREAQVLAALNHPHIGAIYGFEDGQRTNAIVLELIEGDTLAERLSRGALTLDDAMAIGSQIVDALDAAHDLGIVHRDLKPANIKIRPDGTVKVLDFGLARFASGRDDIGADAAETLSADAVVSHAGGLLGTAAYMSPEQAKGQTADMRSDVWAFGCVFYEMLTGTRPFRGNTIAETLSAVQHTEPDWNVLPEGTPRAIRRLLERCLRKDRKQRLAAIADVRWHFDEASHPQESPRSPARLPWIATAVSAVTAIALAATTFYRARDVERQGDLLQFTIDAPDGASLSGVPSPGSGAAAQLAISPDGRNVVFVAAQDGVFKLWLRPLGSLTSTALAGTEGAAFPFWSPDSRVVAFFAGEKLKKVSLDGSRPIELCDALAGRGGSWSRDNVIVFASLRTAGLQRVSSAGGRPVAVTSLASGEDGHRWPFFLPDGRSVLFTATSGSCCPSAKPSAIKIASLDDSTQTKTLMQVESSVGYADGHLFFGRDGTVFAQPFDVGKRAFVGEPVPIAEHVGWEGSRYVSASMSNSGTMAYSEGGSPGLQQMWWFDRNGVFLSQLASTTYDTLALSPDERHVAISMRSAGQLNLDIYVVDLANGNSTRLTSHEGADRTPVWSADGTRIVFEREVAGEFSLRQVSLDGSREELLASDGGRFLTTSWSRDGRFIAFTREGDAGSSDVWLLPLFGDRKPYPIVHTPAMETSGSISPDGHWIAFVSDETGRPKVFMQPFPDGGGRRLLSNEAGSHPVWRRDGKELFYLAEDPARLNTLLVVSIDSSGQTGKTTELFRPGVPRFSDGQIYAVSGDGQRVLGGGGPRPPRSAAGPLRVLMNWRSSGRPRPRD